MVTAAIHGQTAASIQACGKTEGSTAWVNTKQVQQTVPEKEFGSTVNVKGGYDFTNLFEQF